MVRTFASKPGSVEKFVQHISANLCGRPRLSLLHKIDRAQIRKRLQWVFSRALWQRLVATSESGTLARKFKTFPFRIPRGFTHEANYQTKPKRNESAKCTDKKRRTGSEGLANSWQIHCHFMRFVARRCVINSSGSFDRFSLVKSVFRGCR